MSKNNILSAQCGPGPCKVCDVTATISFIEGGTIVNGDAEIGSSVDAGGVGTADDPLVIEVTSCGVITLTVDLDFAWDQGSSNNWIHGISFLDSGGWVAAEGVINPPDPGWIFLDGITGACSGVGYDAGYYWDPGGTSCAGESGNMSNYDGSDCGNPQYCEEDDAWLVDGDPSDNWGIDCSFGCPEFGFELKFCPDGSGTFNEQISFFLTEDGETGAWNFSDGCVFELVFPIIFESAGVQLPEFDETICIGECFTLDAGEGCDDYEWSTGEETQSIEVCPTETTTYVVTVSGDGCTIEGESTIVVDFCCAAEAGEISANTPVCPGELVTYSVVDFNATSEYTQVVFVADPGGNIIEIFPGTSGTYTSLVCGIFTIYSYNYLTAGTATVPAAGMNVSELDCSVACCDLTPFEISFEDTEAPTFPSAPMDITFMCIGDLPPMEDQTWEDNCAGTGTIAGVESAAPDFCIGGDITRTWEYTDNCDNIGVHIQTITIDPPLEAEFTNLPPDETVSCDAIPDVFLELNYTNNMMAPCLIAGSVDPNIVNDYDPICGGTIMLEYTFTDDCGRTIDHTYTITIEPAPEATFDMMPADITLDCSSQDVMPGPLMASNNSAACLIEESVDPMVMNSTDDCGGDITVVWEFTDQCDRTISHTQVITIEPSDEAMFINPPADMNLMCGDPDPVFEDLMYTNAQLDNCEIMGAITPVIEEDFNACGGTITATWEFTDDCDRMISHVQVLTLEPAPPAEFLDLPDDLVMSCSDFETFIPDELNYSNSSQGICEILGSVSGDLGPSPGECGGVVEVEFEYIDDCDRVINYTQTITVEPADEAEFINLPDDITVGCNEVNDDPPALSYTNNETGNCEISGSVDAFQLGTIDECGGTVNYIWSFTDDCFRTISHTQTVTFTPAPEPEWIDPPEDAFLDCDEDLPDDLSLEYDNFSLSPCGIFGSVDPVITQDQNFLILNWSFTNNCSGEEIEHQQLLTISTSVFWDDDEIGIVLCAGGEFDLASIELIDENNTDPDITYHDDFPPSMNNEITNTLVTPTETTTYYILGSNEFNCPDIVEVVLEVESQSSAGSDNSGEICIDEQVMNLYDYLSFDADLDGNFFQILGPNLNFADAEMVNISQAVPGLYLFEYFIDGTADCDPAVALIEVELLPFVEIGVTDISCSADFQTYVVEIINSSYTVTASAGDIIFNTNSEVIIDNIPIGTNLLVSAIDPSTGCQEEITFTPPNCDCPNVPAAIDPGITVICESGTVPQLTAILGVGFGYGANWFDAPIGGNFLATGANYTPTNTTAGIYTFYVETFDLDESSCFSDTRTPITLEILPVPSYDDFVVEICDTDQDGIMSLDSLTLQSYLGINPTETIVYYSSFAEAQIDQGLLFYPITNDDAFSDSYYVIIMNAAGCAGEANVNLNIHPKPILSTIHTKVSCAGDDDGMITIDPFDATSSYILEGEIVTTATIGSLVPGEYELVQIDNNMCGDTLLIQIEEGLEMNMDSFAWDCQDNGTNTDSTDDTYDVTFVVSNDQGANGSYDVLNSANDLLGTFDYGELGLIQLPADDSEPTFTFVDVVSGCTLTQIFGMLIPCSSDCIITADVVEIVCFDNGTDANADDDFYQIDLLVNAINGGAIGTYTVAIDGVVSYSFDYGEMVSFSLPANGELVTLTLSDSEIQACTINVPIGPLSSCSDACILEALVSNVACDDNGTPNDSTDDQYTFDLNVTAQNASSGYNITELSFTGDYGQTYNLGPFTLSDAVQELLIQDIADANCLITVDAQVPAECSDACILEAIASNFTCEDNDTSQDNDDDIFFFDLVVTATNGSSGFNIPSIGFTGSYSEFYTLGPFNIFDPLPIFLIQDIDDANCLFDLEITAPPACSEACVLDVVIDNVICQDNGTADDNSDDVYIFDVLVTGVNISDGYTILELNYDGVYGGISTVGPLNISDGEAFLTIQDNDNPDCIFDTSVMPPPVCSDCNQTLSLTMPEVLSCAQPETEIAAIVSEDGIYEWTGPNGSTYTTESIIVNLPGVYQLFVSFVDGCGLTNEVEVFSNGDVPLAFVNENQSLTCEIEEVVLDASESSYSAGSEFEWTNENGDAISDELTAVVDDVGIYYFQIIDPVSGCTSAQQEVVVDLQITDPSAVILADPGNVLDCFIETIDLSAPGEPFVVYNWIVNNNETIESSQITIDQPLEISLIALDTITGCFNESNLIIEDLTAFPIVLVEELNDLDCEGGQVCFDVSASPLSDNLDYVWYDEDGNQVGENSPIFCTSESGSYLIELTDPESGCVNSDLVYVDDLPVVPSVGLPLETIIAIGSNGEVTVNIDIPMDQVESIIWSPTDNVSCQDCLTTTLIDAYDGLEITVEVISINGCNDIATTVVREEAMVEIYVPTIMDLESYIGNDKFTLFSNSQVVTIEEMFIFDRWGELMFSAYDIPPNDPRLGWDGRFKGEEVEQGVYVYFFKVEYLGGGSEIHTGSITVVR